MIACPNITLGLKLEMKSVSGKISNYTNASEIFSDDSKLLPGNYTPDQINEIIYHLYQVATLNCNSTEIAYSHDLAVLIDLICSNEFYESAVEACDIVTELPID